MSVGGRVTRVEKTSHGDLRICTNEDIRPSDIATCVNVSDTPQTRCIEPGDMFWWQGRTCYWTPKGAKTERETVEIKRTSYSYGDPSAKLIKMVLKKGGECGPVR